MHDRLMARRYHLRETRRSAAGQPHGRPPARQVHHFHVAPEHAGPDAGAERLRAGLLGCEATGIGGRARGSAIGFRLLARSEDALREALAKAGERVLDAADVAEIGADAEDHSSGLAGRAALVHRSPHHGDGRLQPDEDRFADQEMADVELDEGANAGELARGVVVEPMAGMDFEAQRGGKGCATGEPLELGLGLVGMAVGDGVAPGAGMQLDHRRTELRGHRDRRLVGLDEQRDAATRGLQPGDRGSERLRLADDIEPALGGAFLALLGHETGGMRLEPLGEADHLRCRGQLEIERLGQFGCQPCHVGVADMASVFAQVGGDAVGAGGHREKGGTHRIGQGAAAGISHGRNVVDVHAQAQAVLSHRRPSVICRLRRTRQRFKASNVIDTVSVLDQLMHAMRAVTENARNLRRDCC
ncbi:hypothetical protein BOS5A_200102 [Bosea sp. EC-HK365B]|nr:conserved hypothetical protein [Bosea sp. 21B]CAD5286342.1 conserved hypothetical protein [Bosea sp. 7B]VVT57450.1 hypothetical protein BOS5A_200102 [Bosea sp. EC-HK365B]VXC94321.1 conserved hypothetical protein [Bosea sp. 127]